PTEQPFLYYLSATVNTGVELTTVERLLLAEIDRVRRHGIDDLELAKAKSQLKARLVFDRDSVTNIAHQIGYFHTVATLDVFTGLAARIAVVAAEDVAAVARDVFSDSNR